MATVTFSSTFDFNSSSYYYHYTSGTGTSKGRFLCSNYAPYATYWAYTSAAVYGKHYSQVILSITASSYTISSGKTISVFAACAPLSSSDSSNNIILSKNSSKFGAISDAVVLPKNGSASLNITNVITYAAANYNQNWGLYFIGAGSTGSASKVTFNVPSFSSLKTGGLSVNIDSSSWSIGQPYIFKTNRSLIRVPSSGMSSLEDNGCVITASSTYSSTYPAWRCFDYSNSTNAWASSENATGPWVSILMDRKLYDIKVTLYNRNDRSDNIRGPISGIIYGSNDNFTNNIQIGSFSGRNGSTKNASSVIQCNNTSTAYQGVRVKVTDWYPSSKKSYCAIGEIVVEGYEIPSSGGWAKAKAVYRHNGSSWVQI